VRPAATSPTQTIAGRRLSSFSVNKPFLVYLGSDHVNEARFQDLVRAVSHDARTIMTV
jgi:hypothetical protein